MNAIGVEHLYKKFRIPHEKRSTLFEALTSSIFRRKITYEEFIALEDINFTVEKGEFVGVIGNNGSGKSTLLKLIANILRPTRGKIDVNGKVTPFLELGIGFQPDLTARENIYIYGTIMGIKKKELENSLGEILVFADLVRFEDTKLKNFSSGMAARLAFATAIQTKTEILLLDEVLAVGDKDFQEKCFEVFDEFKTKGITTVFVSHDLGAIRKYCDKTLYLRYGKQVAFGDTGEVVEMYL